MPGADSAGVPWEGRAFSANPHGADDGSAPAALLEAVGRFRRREADESVVVDALRSNRLLIPLVAGLGEAGANQHGVRVDKRQELSIVTVEGPDGRSVIPAFSSVEAMRRWNPDARPVPAQGARVALAAVSEGADLVVLDPMSPTEFVVRRPALWALAQAQPWRPSHADPDVLAAFERSIGAEPAVTAVRVASGDPHARLAGPELRIELVLVAGVDQAGLAGLVQRLARAWGADELVASRVDSLHVSIVAAARGARPLR